MLTHAASGPLSAVDEFAQAHDSGAIPARARQYSRLLPASAPGPGQQYAFHVDLDRCSGCKSCVTACHSLNGLDEGETWRQVGLLIGGNNELAVLQHVTSACHHCLDPACLIACPVDAYEKDAATGIVKHLDDQCIGCQYCTFACPYDVPQYNRAKGIVRKCDMCADRLTAGEAPACVQACPQEAISIRLVQTQQVIAESETSVFLPGAPEPRLTLPTTVYETQRVLPRNTIPADYHSLRQSDGHWPLVVLLVLTQLSVGAFCAALAFGTDDASGALSGIRSFNSGLALAFGLLALAVSIFHLGRPQYAFRALIGLKHSWLSREILAFGIFAVLASAYAAGNLGAAGPNRALIFVGGPAAISGLTGVLCSVCVYAITQRALWSPVATVARFLSTTILLGVAAYLLTLILASVLTHSAALDELVAVGAATACRWLLIVTACKLVFEASLFRHLASRNEPSLRRSARLMMGPLSNVTMARFGAGILGGLCMPAFLLGNLPMSSRGNGLELALIVTVAFGACLVGELLERYLFFAAVAAPRMPGPL